MGFSDIFHAITMLILLGIVGSRLKHLPPTLLQPLDRLLSECEGPERLADDLLEMFELILLHTEDMLTAEDRGHLYFPWQLMKAFREAAAQASTVEHEMN